MHASGWLRRRGNDANFASFVAARLQPLQTIEVAKYAPLITAAAETARLQQRQHVYTPPSPAHARQTFSAAAAWPAIAACLLILALTPPMLSANTGGDLSHDSSVRGEFSPAAMPADRADDHAIVTADPQTTAVLLERLTVQHSVPVYQLAEGTDSVTVSVPREALRLVNDLQLDVVADTRITSLSASSDLPQEYGASVALAIEAATGPLEPMATADGAAVLVYVVDSGVYAAHDELAGRIAAGWSSIDDGVGTQDCNGHGTHVAATIAGNRNGLARNATVIPVRVLNCAGTGRASSLIAAVSWVMLNHPGGPAIINFSLGGPANRAVDHIVGEAARNGFVVVAAAGNNGRDACGLSPARAQGVIAIGAVGPDNKPTTFTNTGPCVDMYAPGTDVISAIPTSATANAHVTGTSTAAPQVAGLIARVWHQRPGDTADAIRAHVTTGEAEHVTTSASLVVADIDAVRLVANTETAHQSSAASDRTTSPETVPTESPRATTSQPLRNHSPNESPRSNSAVQPPDQPTGARAPAHARPPQPTSRPDSTNPPPNNGPSLGTPRTDNQTPATNHGAPGETSRPQNAGPPSHAGAPNTTQETGGSRTPNPNPVTNNAGPSADPPQSNRGGSPNSNAGNSAPTTERSFVPPSQSGMPSQQRPSPPPNGPRR